MTTYNVPVLENAATSILLYLNLCDADVLSALVMVTPWSATDLAKFDVIKLINK